MKGGYGNGSHDSKVEDYKEYKDKQFKRYEHEVDCLLKNIKSSSLSEDDKVKLCDKLVEYINNQLKRKL